MTPDDRGPGEDGAAERRDDLADARDVAATSRDRDADARDAEARARESAARLSRLGEARRLNESEARDSAAAERAIPPLAQDEGERPGEALDRAEAHASWRASITEREAAAEDRRQSALDREQSRDYLEQVHRDQRAAAEDRRAAATDRQAAAEDRLAAARDRETALAARQQVTLEHAQVTAADLAAYENLPTRASHGTPGTAEIPAAREPSADEPRGESHGRLARPEAPDGPDSEARRSLETLTHGLELVRHAVELAAVLAGTEEALASTLYEQSTQGPQEATRRRVELAKEATRGARLAIERGEHLRRLAERSAAQLQTAALQGLLRQAGLALAGLAETEKSIASLLDQLARGSEPPDEDLRRESRNAALAAQKAHDRASELHALAETLHRRERHEPTTEQGAKEPTRETSEGQEPPAPS